MTRKPVTVNNLADLKMVKQEIAEQAAARAQQVADNLRVKQQKAADANLFMKAAGTVKPLPNKRTAPLKKGST